MRIPFRPPILLVAAAFATATFAAQPPELVRDIGDTLPFSIEEYFLHYGPVAVMGGSAYFFNDDGIHGRELWRSSGRAGGTSLLKDVCPGACGTVTLAPPAQVAALTDRVVFIGNDGVHGAEPWVSDGSPAGTRMLADLKPGLRGSTPYGFSRAGDRIFFSADDGIHGREVWVTDGTTAGTVMVADLSPSGTSTALNISAAIGPVLIFGEGSSNAPGLWRSDGTALGTYLLAEVRPFQQSWSANALMMEIGGRVVFWGQEAQGDTTPHLWVTDGTTAGTAQLGAVDFPYPFAKGENAVYFFAYGGVGSELWQTDGTPAGTFGVSLPLGVQPQLLFGTMSTVGDRVFFAATDSDHGTEPWTASSGTVNLLRDIRPGPDSSLHMTAEEGASLSTPFFSKAGSLAVFLADDGLHGMELWASDGLETGTELVADLTPGPASTPLDYLQGILELPEIGGSALFRVRYPTVRYLVATDGTAGGTAIIGTLSNQDSAFLAGDAGIRIFQDLPVANCFQPVGRGVLFAPVDGIHGKEPWFSNGRDTGTHLVADLLAGESWSEPGVCKAIDGRGIFSVGKSDDGAGLWSTSGAAGDAVEVEASEWSTYPGSWALWREKWNATTRGGLGRTDGTPAGTEIEGELPEFFPYQLETSGDFLFAGDFNLSLWNEASSTFDPLTDFDSGEGIYPIRLTHLGSLLLFVGNSPDSTGSELWRSDGTPEGTWMVKDVLPGALSGIRVDFTDPGGATAIVSIGSRAVFAADDGVHGEELWVTDGTTVGTELLADLFPGPYPSVPTDLTRVGAWVYFVAEGPGVGRELWRTDGQPEGTELVADLVPGAGSSIPQHLTAGGSELYFSAWTPRAGREPWRLRDAGAAPPEIVQIADIAKKKRSSSPEAFLEVGGGLFLVASDNQRGFELWHLQEPDSIFSDGFESTDTKVWSRVEP